jgi:hypothetical protein
MKKTFIKSAVAIHLFLLLTAGIASQAQTTEKPVSEIKTTGFLKNEPVYELNINNASFGRYTIVITDEYGTPMYEETLAGTYLSRRFVLNRLELGSTGVIIQVLNGGIKEATHSIKNNRIYSESAFVTVKK